MVYWPNNSKLPAVYNVSSVAQFSHVRWEIGPVAGAIYATTVIEDKLYFNSYRGKTYLIVCLNPNNGETLWEYGSITPFHINMTFNEDTVYFIEEERRLVALSLKDQTRKWSYEAAKRIRTTPVIANGTVYIGSRDNGVHAVDAETGERKWVFYTKGEIRASVGVGRDGTIYVSSFDTRVYALSSETGRLKWYFRPLGHHVICSAPAVANQTVYFGSNNFNLYAVDSETGTEKWEFCGGNWIRTYPVVYEARVYFACYKASSSEDRYGTYNNAFYCLDTHTGEVVWSKNFPDIFTGPFIADERIFIGCQDGIFRALDLETGDVAWTFGKEGGWVFDPAFANGTVYVPWSDQIEPVSTYPKLLALATTSSPQP